VTDDRGDDLPEELDVTSYVGPYEFPDIARRGRIAWVYVVGAVGCAAAWFATQNEGMAGAAALFGVVALIHLLASWPLRVDEGGALMTATRTVGFPVGHASAQLAWRGLRSRPTWRILLYSADSPPSQRGLVELDAVDGSVLGEYTEANPEDWSQFGA